MTYKKIVEMLVENEAREFLENTLKENGVQFRWIFVEESHLEMDKNTDTVYWEVKCRICMNNYIDRHVTVGGTADDLCGICSSVIWINNKHDIAWMAVKNTRDALGIKEFKLA